VSHYFGYDKLLCLLNYCCPITNSAHGWMEISCDSVWLTFSNGRAKQQRVWEQRKITAVRLSVCDILNLLNTLILKLKVWLWRHVCDLRVNMTENQTHHSNLSSSVEPSSDPSDVSKTARYTRIFGFKIECLVHESYVFMRQPGFIVKFAIYKPKLPWYTLIWYMV
jgi:hypothetical protein